MIQLKEITREKILNRLLKNNTVRSGSELNFRCPFCGDSKKDDRKMRGWYNFDKDVFHCFNCDESISRAFVALVTAINPNIDIINLLVANSQKQDIINSVSENKTVCEETKTEILYYDDFIAKCKLLGRDQVSDAAQKYWIDRKLNTVNYPIYFCDNPEERYVNRIIIPFFDENGKCIYFQARKIDDNSFGVKYLNPSGSKNVLFGIDRIDKSKPVVLLEGPIDSLFVENAIACMTTGLSRAQQKLVEGLDIICMFDNDAAGIDASIKYAKKGYKIFLYPKYLAAYKDINQYVVATGMNIKLDEVRKYSISGFEAFIKLSIEKLKFHNGNLSSI